MNPRGINLEELEKETNPKEGQEMLPIQVVRLEADRKEANQRNTCLYFQLYYFLDVITKNIALIDTALLIQSRGSLQKLPKHDKIVKNYDESYEEAQSCEYRYCESYKFTELLRKNQRSYKPETVMFLYDFLSHPEILAFHNFPHLVKMFYEDFFRYQGYHPGWSAIV